MADSTFNFPTVPDAGSIDYEGLFPANDEGFDLGSLFPSGGSMLSAPQSLQLPTTTGIRGIVGDISSLVSTVYRGEAMINREKALNRISQAQLANQLETVKTAPNIWLVLGIGAAGLFALELLDRKK